MPGASRTVKLIYNNFMKIGDQPIVFIYGQQAFELLKSLIISIFLKPDRRQTLYFPKSSDDSFSR